MYILVKKHKAVKINKKKRKRGRKKEKKCYTY